MTRPNTIIAQTILAQLGGHRFIVMTGADRFTAGSNGELTFKIPPVRTPDGKRVNVVKIILEPTDTYRVQFIDFDAYRRTREDLLRVVAEVDDVYADSLASVFSQYTGLAVTL